MTRYAEQAQTLGGYDEEMLAGAVEDMDLIEGRRLSAFFIKLTQRGLAAIETIRQRGFAIRRPAFLIKR